ncbi:MAG: cbb3-type cytochrome c oxidase subunit 3 [Hyphomicrobiaceae bacterium]|nr:cbb3-type cytochrome c oxidase subunit 3 [Hyphomicrobiaceae bacterium]
MTYDVIATYSQVTSLLLFVAMFLGVLVYALWPANGRRFEMVQRQALDLDKSELRTRGRT